MDIFCHIIASDFTEETKLEIESVFSLCLHGYHVFEFAFSDIKPYWKVEGWGELSCEFFINEEQFTYLKNQLASNWISDCADRKYSKLISPKIEFLWLFDKNS